MGMAVNIYALTYGTFIVVFVPFPPRLPVTALNMNYCAPVFLAVYGLLLVDWVVRGRNRFREPLEELLVPISEGRVRRNS